MPNVNQVIGNDGSDILVGSADADLIYGFDPGGEQADLTSITATRVATGLSQPVFATAAPGDLDHLYVVERTGTIRILDLKTGATSLFLDLSAEITTAGEGGLLGFAFDPHFLQNGYVYVDLTNTSDDTEVRRYQISGTDPDQADPASKTLVIGVDQPSGRTNHKAGWIGFGPDGDLYITLGDGGSSPGATGDFDGNAQNIGTLLGKVLRLDVRSDAFPNDPARNYAIPSDNPFIGTAGALPEIWALGFRNPFRAGFDRALGDFYIGDVGEGRFEEVDIGQSGGNYGWNVFEGPASFSSRPLGPGTLTAPIHFYDHTVGHAIIGGYVYRGESEAGQGLYFFADDSDSKIFTLQASGSSWIATDRTSQVVSDVGNAAANPTSFAEDALGNLYILGFGGNVFRLTPNAASADVGDDISGAGGNDTIHGGSGNDVIRGASGNDVLYGGPGDDTFLGAGGNDTIDGGAGTNTAVFLGKSTNHVIAGNTSGATVEVSGSVATLTNIRFLQFSDRTIDLDRPLPPPFTWTLVAIPDLNGDGKADLLWQSNTTGEADYWTMNGISPTGFGFLTNVGPNWRLAATPDLNGDGNADLLWQNNTTGEVDYWTMNGISPTGFGFLTNIGPNWRLAAVPDLNGDGKADLLWQHNTTGEVDYWTMNGINPTAFGFLTNVGLGWRLAATPDVNGDGKADLLWQHNTTGEVDYWTMSGFTPTGFGFLTNVGLDWRLAATPDLDRDGNADLLWQNTTSAEVDYWTMHGIAPKGFGFLTNIG